MADDTGVPYLRVIRGDATAEEIAALVTALTALAAARRGATARHGERAAALNWNDKARLLKAPRYRAGAGWRGSALP